MKISKQFIGQYFHIKTIVGHWQSYANVHSHFKQTKRTTNKKDWFIPLFILLLTAKYLYFKFKFFKKLLKIKTPPHHAPTHATAHAPAHVQTHARHSLPVKPEIFDPQIFIAQHFLFCPTLRVQGGSKLRQICVTSLMNALLFRWLNWAKTVRSNSNRNKKVSTNLWIFQMFFLARHILQSGSKTKSWRSEEKDDRK